MHSKHSRHSTPPVVTHWVIQLQAYSNFKLVDRTFLCKQSARIACTLGSTPKTQLYLIRQTAWKRCKSNKT